MQILYDLIVGANPPLFTARTLPKTKVGNKWGFLIEPRFIVAREASCSDAFSF